MAYVCFLRRDEQGEASEEGKISVYEDEDKEVTFGRDPDQADVHVDDSKASSLHCKVRFDGVNFWVIDLGSRNGIKVNHKRVENSPLLDGYIFKVGKTYFRFHSDDVRHKQSKHWDIDESDDDL